MKRSATRLAAAGVFASAAAVVLALVLDGEWGETLIVFAPVALVPLIPLARSFYRELAPRSSRVGSVLGLTGFGAFVALVVLLAWNEWRELPQMLFPAVVLLASTMGLWIAWSSAIGLKTGVQPAGLAVLGIVTGVAWTLLLLVSTPWVTLPMPLGGSLFVLWLVSYLFWATWTGGWVLSSR